MAGVIAGFGAIILSFGFLQLARTDNTERLYLVALEYGFGVALFVAGVGIMIVAVLNESLF
jgi:hypothetical protein